MKKHYDKALLLVSFICLGFFVLKSLMPDEIKLDYANELDDSINLYTTDSHVALESNSEFDLMPGNYVFFEGESDTVAAKIDKVIFKGRSQVSITLKNGKIIDGKLSSREDTTLDQSNLRSSFTMMVSQPKRKSSTPVKFSDIEKIKGNAVYLLDNDVKLSDVESRAPRFYQRIESSKTISSFKPKVWKNPSLENNKTFYDVFTPPLIYLVNNKLTTSLPTVESQEPPEEPFGAKMVEFKYVPYRFVLKSWIANTPTFEDRVLTERLGRPIRSRIEVGTFYKLNNDTRLGQPSLLPTTEDDKNRSFVIHSFDIEELPQKSGGLRTAGIAVVEDFRLNKEPFKVNSLETNVWAGEIQFTLAFELEDLELKEEICDQNDIGKSIEYYGRIYKIISIDAPTKKIVISKVNPQRPNEEFTELSVIDL